ncbi:hypothetical protein CpipJ_CPIJ000356 [Culex quinquefasciatus]|uniref:Uncharacterized protein n=1 Tax=Culex quinquefasciatus TaxID=7176 RepID=B0VZZ2_CULQU|nr:hypothetical protein CpipJ_CPIJ000356 [Culex quinquefasciatus]|eukprot:XP_001842026.1 hypothetical protein CpipJ_CPIJ000356 [Culex quinquefasciatus]
MSPSLSSDLTTHKSTNELDRPQPRTGLHHTHTTLPWLHFFLVHRCLELQQRSTMHLYLRSSDVGWSGVCMCMLTTNCVAPQGSVPGVQPESGSCQTETGQLSKSAGQLLPRTVISIGTMLYVRMYLCEKRLLERVWPSPSSFCAQRMQPAHTSPGAPLLRFFDATRAREESSSADRKKNFNMCNAMQTSPSAEPFCDTHSVQ